MWVRSNWVNLNKSFEHPILWRTVHLVSESRKVWDDKYIIIDDQEQYDSFLYSEREIIALWFIKPIKEMTLADVCIELWYNIKIVE